MWVAVIRLSPLRTHREGEDSEVPQCDHKVTFSLLGHTSSAGPPTPSAMPPARKTRPSKKGSRASKVSAKEANPNPPPEEIDTESESESDSASESEVATEVID